MIVVAAAVMFDVEGRVLLCSRPEGKPPAGWEFPGGKVEPGETLGKALERELLEELDLPGRAGKEITVVTAPPVELHFIEFFSAKDAAITPREGQLFRWQTIGESMPEDLLPNDRPVWEILKKIRKN